MSERLALLRLLQLSSPALPVGAYAYSHGLEWAVASGCIADAASAARWILGVVEHAIVPLEVPVLSRLVDAFTSGDEASVTAWTDFLRAARESAELAQEDRHMGVALARLLVELGIEDAEAFRRRADASYVTLYALACARWQIRVEDAQQAFLFGFCENQVAAAIKLVPLGQTAGQKLLVQAMAQIPAWVDSAKRLTEEELGPAAVGLAMASAWHEEQYSRLFRS